MLKSLFIIGSLTLFFLFSCKGQQNGATTNRSNMEVLVKDNYGGDEKERFLVIKDQKSLAEFYGQFNRTRKPGLPVPEIDFNKEMILVWSPGEQNGNSDLKVKSHAGKNLILRKTKFKKDKEFTAITRPVTIYKLPNNADSIVIE